MGIPGHLFLRSGSNSLNWAWNKGVHQSCILLPGLFNLYVEYIMRNAGMDEEQAGIKIDERNINNQRYAITPALWQKTKKS